MDVLFSYLYAVNTQTYRVRFSYRYVLYRSMLVRGTCVNVLEMQQQTNPWCILITLILKLICNIWQVSPVLTSSYNSIKMSGTRWEVFRWSASNIDPLNNRWLIRKPCRLYISLFSTKWWFVSQTFKTFLSKEVWQIVCKLHRSSIKQLHHVMSLVRNVCVMSGMHDYVS